MVHQFIGQNEDSQQNIMKAQKPQKIRENKKPTKFKEDTNKESQRETKIAGE